MVDKTLQLQLEIEQHEHHSQTGVKWCAPYGYPSYYSGDKSWMMKELDCDYDKWNTSVVICDRYFVSVNQGMVTTEKLSKWWLLLKNLGITAAKLIHYLIFKANIVV
jgi:hypothetical protein